MVVVEVVDVGLDEVDDSRFLFTMLDRPVEAARRPIVGAGEQTDEETSG